MLDIWDGQEENLEPAFRSKEIEYGGELGIVEQQGWYTQESILKKNPELATYRGLLSSNKTEKVYMRPLAFGEFCWLRKNGDVEREKVFLQEIIQEESLKFEKKEANLTEQTAILFESLRSNIPSLNRFCKGLKLLEYEELFEQNELNVKKLMHLRETKMKNQNMMKME